MFISFKENTKYFSYQNKFNINNIYNKNYIISTLYKYIFDKFSYFDDYHKDKAYNKWFNIGKENNDNGLNKYIVIIL